MLSAFSLPILRESIHVLMFDCKLRSRGKEMPQHKIYSMSFAKIYPCYVNKIEKKKRTVAELHQVITWLTGYDDEHLQQQLMSGASVQEFFQTAPALNKNRRLIKGTICGVRVEDIEEPLMQEIRYLDKLVDELAQGKDMLVILRS